MNAGQREHLLELHRLATQLWGLASQQPNYWAAAYEADKKFTDCLLSLDVEPHNTGDTT